MGASARPRNLCWFWKNGSAPCQRFLTGRMMLAVVASRMSFGRTPHLSNQEPRKRAKPRLLSFCLQRDTVAPDQKTRAVESFVEAFAKAAQVSQVPDEAITTDTREPSHMFLALSGTARRLASGRTCSRCCLAASST